MHTNTTILVHISQTRQSPRHTITNDAIISGLFHTNYIFQGIKANIYSSQNSEAHFQMDYK